MKQCDQGPPPPQKPISASARVNRMKFLGYVGAIVRRL
jgi:hypothetical protein